MAKVIKDQLVAETPIKETDADEPRVRIMLPLREDAEEYGMKVDQTEQVIINGNITNIRRGVPVDVKVPVFLQLKQRFPNI